MDLRKSDYLMYRKLFTQYIIEKLNLKKYDDEIAESKLNFIEVKEKQMDIYQYFSKDKLKYFYIRNNIHIEKLTDEEQKFLQKIKLEEPNELGDIEKDFIEKTYSKVIFEDVLENGEICNVFYGPDSRSFISSNNSIVIGMRYDEFENNGLDDEKWDELHEKQLDFWDELKERMELELKMKINKHISIIRYDDFSIEKRLIEEDEKTLSADEER